jgi:hypothetical protein
MGTESRTTWEQKAELHIPEMHIYFLNIRWKKPQSYHGLH